MGRSEELLDELIGMRLMSGANIEEIDRKIWAIFGETWAIFCTDMSGFTRRTDKFGIIHFLTLIHEMRRLMRPLILNHNGMLLKTEADSLLVLFRDLSQAVECAIEAHATMAKYNESRNIDYQISLSIGIGYGRILKIGDSDCYGSEVNRAFKLGEDIAKAEETLLTPSAYKLAQDLPGLNFQKIASGHDLISEYYLLETTR